jgi:glycosyltransferase involved in cell wall biosynthesis
MDISVILTTYNQPEHLERVLWGYAAQTWRGAEIVVADDGSDERTAAVVDRVAAATGLDVVHVWHPDDGFRKTTILNRAIVASRGDYLIFSDGDCVPRDDFVATHARLARPRAFLSGGYVKLPAAATGRLTTEDVRAGRCFSLRWLRAAGWKPDRRVTRFARVPWFGRVLDLVTPTRASWNGHNASTWRDLVFAANGFDADLGYGGLDRAFGELLRNAGISGWQVRHRAVCVHLDHPRPYVDPERWRRNHEIRARIRRDGITRSRAGIAELSPDERPVVRRALDPAPRVAVATAR